MILVVMEENQEVSKELLNKAKELGDEVVTVSIAQNAIEKIKELKPDIVLIGATNKGRDLAAQTASALNTGLTADCTDLRIEDGDLIAIRPTYGGELMAEIKCKTKPQMATVRAGVFQSYENEIGEPNSSPESLVPSHEIVIAGGRGMKNKQGFELLQQLADKLGAKLGASRGAVDMGIAPKSIQIGQTGNTVKPKTYIACGISGAIQHTVGMDKSTKIIVINKDKSAPIFKLADVGIVGDVFEILPELIKKIN